MATALDTTNVTPFGYAAESEVDLDMKEDWVLQKPNRYAILDIDCTLVSGKLEFSFRDPLPARTLTGGLPAAIADARTRPMGPGTSRATPLDFGLFGDSAYIFLRIVGPTNMTFSATKKALRHKNADRDYYGELRHVTTTEVEEGALPECKIVYFIADPLAPPLDGFDHGFDLNVELEMLATDGSKRMISFKIDPDVRYPGNPLV
jgi:hypothetical protein